MVYWDVNFTFSTIAPEEKPKEKQYDDATQLLVDTADAARKEFDEIDRKNRYLNKRREDFFNRQNKIK